MTFLSQYVLMLVGEAATPDDVKNLLTGLFFNCQSRDVTNLLSGFGSN